MAESRSTRRRRSGDGADPDDKAQKAARLGADKLISELENTGTGKDKLDVAREVLNDLGDASSEEDGAEAVLTHLRRRNVADGTIEKAEAFIDRGMMPSDANRGVEPPFNPRFTAPGSVPPNADVKTEKHAAPVTAHTPHKEEGGKGGHR